MTLAKVVGDLQLRDQVWSRLESPWEDEFPFGANWLQGGKGD